MLQNYTAVSSDTGQPVALKGNKGILILLALTSLTLAIYTAYITGAVSLTKLTNTTSSAPETTPAVNEVPMGNFGTDSVATVVSKALYFKSLLTAAQQSTVELTYTTTLARKWSNLPCGSGCSPCLVSTQLNMKTNDYAGKGKNISC